MNSLFYENVTSSNGFNPTTTPHFYCPWQGATCHSWDIIFIFLLSNTIGEKLFNKTRSLLYHSTISCELNLGKDRVKVFHMIAKDSPWIVSENSFKSVLQNKITFQKAAVSLPESPGRGGFLLGDLWAAIDDLTVSGSKGRGRAIVIISNLFRIPQEIHMLTASHFLSNLESSLENAGINPLRILDLPRDPENVSIPRLPSAAYSNLTTHYFLPESYESLAKYLQDLVPCTPKQVALTSPIKTHSIRVALSISLGLAFFCLLFLCMVLFYRVRGEQRQRRVTRIQLNSLRVRDDSQTSSRSTFGYKLHFKKKKKRNLDQWEVPPGRLQIDYSNKLGSGAFSDVYKGVLFDTRRRLSRLTSSSAQAENREVAVKMLQRYKSHLEADFLQEITFMKDVGQHPHLLDLIGAVTLSSPACIITEYCAGGDLLNWVRVHQSEIISEIENPTNSEISLRTLLSFAWQISDGLFFLSSNGYIHRDVAARNVLIDCELTAKICDYGLCRQVESGVYVMQRGRLPIKWMAIESLENLYYSTKSDVWSFGVLLYEMYSFGKTPFPCIQPVEMVNHLKQGNRLEKPEHCSNEIYQMMFRCWEENADNRPTFEEIRHFLVQLLDKASESDGYLMVLSVSRSGSNTSM